MLSRRSLQSYVRICSYPWRSKRSDDPTVAFGRVLFEEGAVPKPACVAGQAISMLRKQSLDTRRRVLDNVRIQAGRHLQCRKP